MFAWIALCATLAPLAAAAITCPDGFVDKQLGDNRCYLFSTEKKTWTMAYTTCLTSAEGAGLLTIPSRNAFFPMSYFVQAGGADLWTGLLSFPGGVRTWADGSPYDPALDDFFAPDAGDELNGYISGADGLLHLSDGGEPRGFVCFVDMTPPVTTTPAATTTTSPTTPPPPPCAAGWQQYGNLCYLFSDDAQYWATAAHACHAVGAELVSVHDSGALTFLLLTAGEEVYWIGLEDRDGLFVWEDGSDASDVPALLGPYMDAWSAGKDCLALNATGFPDVVTHQDCISQQRYICVQPATTGEAYYPEMDNFFLEL